MIWSNLNRESKSGVQYTIFVWILHHPLVINYDCSPSLGIYPHVYPFYYRDVLALCNIHSKFTRFYGRLHNNIFIPTDTCLHFNSLSWNVEQQTLWQGYNNLGDNVT